MCRHLYASLLKTFLSRQTEPPRPCGVGDEPLRPLRGHLPFQGRLFSTRSPKGMPRAKHVLPRRTFPPPKHRPVVENGTFSTGPFVRNRREPRPGRPREALPTQAACLRGVRGPARRMESSPAPGSLWFLSPAGKELVRPRTHETPSSHTLSPARVPPLLIPLPSLVSLPNSSLPLSLRPKTTKKRSPKISHPSFSIWIPATSYSPGPCPAKYHRR